MKPCTSLAKKYNPNKITLYFSIKKIETEEVLFLELTFITKNKKIAANRQIFDDLEENSLLEYFFKGKYSISWLDIDSTLYSHLSIESSAQQKIAWHMY